MRKQDTQVGAVRRVVLISLGAISVALGVLGIIVPGLPTTVFLLLASYFFARSSPALYRRLVEHPQLGRYLELARQRAMPLRAKVIALAAMWTGISASSILLAGTGVAAPLVLVALGVVGTAVLLFWVKTLPADAAVIPVTTRRN